MSDDINESLLEMHFHSAIVNHFSSLYGFSFLRLLKPVPQKEAWVGFDQGWVYTKVSNTDLLNSLRDAVQNSATSVGKFYIGYFLQFKVVHKMMTRSKLMPSGFSPPYFRSELSLEPNKTTGISQHETLVRLSAITNASVSYACGMMFDLEELYRPPNLKNLRCVPLATAPSGWTTNQRHFIAFRSTSDSSPKWCSEPVEGFSMSFDEWASPNSRYGPKALSPQQILDLIRSTANVSHKGEVATAGGVPESFTLLEFETGTNIEITGESEDAEPLNPENLAPTLSKVGIESTQEEISGLLNLLLSRHIQTVGQLISLPATEYGDVISKIYRAEEGRAPSNAEMVANLTNLVGCSSEQEAVERIKGWISLQRAWDELKSKGLA